MRRLRVVVAAAVTGTGSTSAPGTAEGGLEVRDSVSTVSPAFGVGKGSGDGHDGGGDGGSDD
ncbi:hypothetical protein Gocc_1039 [Gaiella occulta]|uniref:Uncharacterized protein n=1 Tax=Gaiella occulta TaxID=1002870 RepID=A0A7M2Z0B8_9ACTN|nr:hypothetical protein [Gaiella occulta]RDI75241.1 hypothetical protein Gocc_1039 [Gaiella occulta]